ncbi:D-galactarolactone cycloisomerase [Ancylobacter aquaticus]|uniref:D-galactarolactone cycloisomerase n=1 Tax=Ancylobacter aquaticus TaxID=100 RepID=A0A4R1ICW8_ANCAQ|nr:D-galactarolactone cycloisomerase [Ancylobacter aquaticus]
MQIKDVRVSVHRFKNAVPLINKPIEDDYRIICEIETDEGHVGIGMASRFLWHGVAAIVEKHLGPAIIGMDPRDLEKIHARLQPMISERGAMTGINLAGLSCVDLALWDVIGKASNRTVAQMLGGAKDYADAYVTYGFGAFETEHLIEMARVLIGKGHTRLKMLVGTGRGLVADARRVAAVREAVGEDILLAVDANESLRAEEALRIAKMIEPYNIAWFEDPLQRVDARDLGNMRKRTTIPLSAGQMDGHALRFREWIEHDAIDIFMPNSMYNGGMTETRRVAHLSQIYNKPLSDAGGGGVWCVHHVAGFRNGTLAEIHLGTEQVEEQMFVDPPRAVNGRIAIPAAPGFGVTLDRDVLKETLVTA